MNFAFPGGMSFWKKGENSGFVQIRTRGHRFPRPQGAGRGAGVILEDGVLGTGVVWVERCWYHAGAMRHDRGSCSNGRGTRRGDGNNMV